MQQLPPGFELDASPRPAAPRGPVYGPAPAQPSPVEQQRLENEAIRVGIAQQAEARQQAEQERNEARRAAGFDATEGERKASGFLQRAINAETSFRSLGDVEPRGLVGQAIQDTSPNLSNIMSDADQQRAVQAEREFIAAVLRYDSGAAIPPEEFVTTGQIYFPRPGNPPEVLAQKAQARRVALQGLKDAGGRLTADVELPDFDALQQASRSEAREVTRRDAAPLGYETGFDKMGRDDVFDRAQYLQEQFGVSQGEETRLIGVLNANRGNKNLTMEGLQQIYSDAGVPPPDEAGMTQLLEDLRSGQFSPATAIDTGAAEQEYVEGIDRALEQTGDENTQANAALFGLSRGVTFALNDEATGLGAAVGAALQGENPTTAYKVTRDMVRRQTDRTRESYPITSYGSEFGGALVTGGRAFGAPQTARQAAGIGATEGAIYGFGAGEGATNSLIGAGTGAAGGAAIGAAVQPIAKAATNALAKRAAGRQIENAQDIAQAAERQGVTMRGAEMNPQLRGQRAQVQQTPQGRPQIAQADADDLAEIENALVRGLGGSTARMDEGGGAVQGGVREARNGLRRRAQIEYRAASAEAGDLQVDPARALDAIDQQIEELAANGANRNAKRIEYLRSTRQDISRRGGLTIDGLRSMRTDLRADLDNAGVYTSDFERRMIGVIDSMSQDIGAALRTRPEAAARYAEADRLWRQQAELGENIGDLLLGRRDNKSPGAAASQVLNWAKKDPQRISRLMDEVDPQTQSEVRALVAGQLGRSTNGDFSLARFITDTSGGSGSKIGLQALRSIFGEEGVQAIRDLRSIAKVKLDTQSATNRSQTGGIVDKARNSFRRLLLGGFGFNAASGAGGPAGALAGGVAIAVGELAERLGTERTLRLVLNPDVTRWLKNAPNATSPRAIDNHFNRLRSLAQSRGPTMIADVDALERALIGAVNDNSAGRLAAEQQQQENQ